MLLMKEFVWSFKKQQHTIGCPTFNVLASAYL